MNKSLPLGFAITPDSLIQMLNAIDYDDQKYRLELEGELNKGGRDTTKIAAIWRKIRIVDSINQKKVFLLLDSQGWPSRKVIGDDGAVTIWAVIQHSKLEQEEKYFPILEKAVKDSELEAKYLAYTKDRILTDKGLKQQYGTQLWQVAGAAPCLLPLENPGSVDSLRATVSLPPLKIFLKDRLGIDWDLHTYYDNLPKAEKYLNKVREHYLSTIEK